MPSCKCRYSLVHRSVAARSAPFQQFDEFCPFFPFRLRHIKMAVSGANLHNVFMLLTLEPQLARNPYLVLHVRRDHLVSDTLRELTMYSDVDLKKPLKVRVNTVTCLDLPHTLPLTRQHRRVFLPRRLSLTGRKRWTPAASLKSSSCSS